MNIIKFYSSIFTAEETNSMAKQIIVSIENSCIEDIILQKAIKAIKEKNMGLTTVLNAQHVNPYTNELKEADDWRDDIHMGGKHVIKGMTHWVFDTAIMEAATRLEKVIYRHGWALQDFGYQNQSSATNSLIAELKKDEYRKDITTCGLTSWFEVSVKGQERFENLFNVKIGHENKKESLEKREAQIPVSDSIKKLVIYLNSIIIFNEDDKAWGDIYNNIEGILK